MMGRKRSLLIRMKKRKHCYHEVGHALVAQHEEVDPFTR
ncbi:MAG: hypothetical protein CM1200mP28_14800 [Deltaproteobacteria bacterium]|nr:MAG: hypothetical protein CM1200mP28_14800 [Deltaproteobacteria bacterium]